MCIIIPTFFHRDEPQEKCQDTIIQSVCYALTPWLIREQTTAWCGFRDHFCLTYGVVGVILYFTTNKRPHVLLWYSQLTLNPIFLRFIRNWSSRVPTAQFLSPGLAWGPFHQAVIFPYRTICQIIPNPKVWTS